MENKDVYKFSQFSNLSYVLWDSLNIASSNSITRAGGSQFRLPEIVGAELFEPGQGGNWSIPSFHPNDNTGFAANVFANGTEKVLAIRGTEVEDAQLYLDVFQADLVEIGIVGMSLSQATSMFNYIQRLVAPSGAEDVLQLQIHASDTPPIGTTRAVSVEIHTRSGAAKTLYYWFEASHNGRGEGVFAAGDTITVTGHSLGGHLAALALRLFPTLFSDAVLFNAPNFDPVAVDLTPRAINLFIGALAPNSPLKPFVSDGYYNAQQATEPLINSLFAEYLAAPPAPRFVDVSARIHNYQSEDSPPGDDLDIISGVTTGVAASPPQAIRTEANSHAMDQIMDSLAVYALLERLQPGLGMPAIARLIDASANTAGNTLETLVAALAFVISGVDAEFGTVVAGPVGYPDEQTEPGTFNLRSAIHNRILALDAAIDATPDLRLESLVDLDIATIASRAATSRAYRYALLALNPFAIVGDERLYATSTELDEKRFTQSYLADRAAYIAARDQRNLDDAIDTSFGPYPVRYVDYASEETLQVPPLHLLPPGAAALLSPKREIGFGSVDADRSAWSEISVHRYGMQGADTLFGSADDDVLDGGEGNDVLEGGAGVDSLFGGGGSDHLIGSGTGQPDDQVADLLEGGEGFDYYRAGFGDRIRDSDGEVTVTLDGRDIALGAQSIHAQMILPEVEVYRSEAEPALYYVYSPVSHELRVGGIVIESFNNGNLGISLPGPSEPDEPTHVEIGTAAAEALFGTPAADRLEGRGDDDSLFGRAGDDLLYGGEGNDYIASERGADRAYGEQGRDVLFGHEDDDVLDGGAEGDLITGDDGNDIVFGGDDVTGNALFGGAGHDILIGSPGPDFLAGSARVTAASRDWELLFGAPSLGRSLQDPRNVVFDRFGGAAEEVNLPRDPDADFLFGGAGRDNIIGSAGDDWIDGGPDEDVIAGADGNDHIYGGDGNDHIRGSGGADVIDGGAGRDFIIASGGDETLQDDGADTVYGGPGDDRLYGGPGNDLIMGGADNDFLAGDGGNDILHGGDGDDELRGVDGNDYLLGDAGADFLRGERGNDGLEGGAGADLLLGGEGDDALYGGADRDQLQGGAGHDALFGGDGNDALYGDEGNDVLAGEQGSDFLAGGAGNDLYVYANGADEIIDVEGDNGLTILGGIAPRDIVSVEAGADLYLVFGDGAQIQIRNWREPGAIDHIRFGASGYLARANFLNPTQAGTILETSNVAGSALGSSGDDHVTIATPGAAINAGAGDDRYVIAATGAIDISDPAGANSLEFAPGITLESLTIAATDGRYRITAGDFSLTTTPGEIARFVFANGLVLSGDDFAERFAAVLDPVPTLLNKASNQAAFTGEAFSYTLPDPQFIDLNPRDQLRIDVTGRGGRALPPWLQYDAETRTLSGSPTHPEVVTVEVGATDLAGHFKIDRFDIDVMPTLAGHEVAIFEPESMTVGTGSWVDRFDKDLRAPYLVGVGDLNADGLDDVLELMSGRVVFGSKKPFGLDFPARELNGHNGFNLTGYSFESLQPAILTPAMYSPRHGDFTGDGIDDVVIGERLLAGHAGRFARSIDYPALPAAAIASAGSTKLPHLIAGVPTEAAAFQPVGDLNGDQREDYFGIIEVRHAPQGIVVFGVDGSDNRSVNLSRLNGADGFAVEFTPYPGYPASVVPLALSYAGWGGTFSALGDLNGDGVGDLGLGSSPYLFTGQSSFGAVIFGDRAGFGGAINLGDLNGVNGFLARIPETTPGVPAPKFFSRLGDLNGDHFDDVLVGSAAEPAGSYIVYGRASFTQTITRGTPGDDIVVATTDVFTGGGNDLVLVPIDAVRSSTSLGSGDDHIKIAASHGTHHVDGGPGRDRYEVGRGSFELHITDPDGGTLYVDMTLGGAIIVRPGSVVIEFGPGAPTIHLDDIDHQNILGGPRPIDSIEFSDGSVLSFDALIARGFDLAGGDRDDDLLGTDVTDRISAGDGADRLAGGRGDDELNGGAGDDVYVIELNGGADLIRDPSGVDVLAWGPGIRLEDMTFAAAGSDLVLRVAGNQTRIADWYLGLANRIERFQFGVSEYDALALINRAPIAGDVGEVPSAAVGQAFAYTLEPGLFVDPDPNDHLVLSATLEGGSALPQWLRFDPDSGVFSGAPASDIGDLAVTVTARDPLGAGATTNFMLSVENPIGVNVATDGPDRLIGTALDDQIDGRAGDDEISGLGGADRLYGSRGSDTLNGGAGDDRLDGGVGEDRLRGGDGHDRLLGRRGADHLYGNGGNDVLIGGPGDDHYYFSRGDGHDRVRDYGLARERNVAHFGFGIRPTDLKFTRAGLALDIAVPGTPDRLTIEHWFGRRSAPIEHFEFADGRTLSARAASLASAMAAFDPSYSGQAVFSGLAMGLNQDAVLAAAWQSG